MKILVSSLSWNIVIREGNGYDTHKDAEWAGLVTGLSVKSEGGREAGLLTAGLGLLKSLGLVSNQRQFIPLKNSEGHRFEKKIPVRDNEFGRG